MKAGVGTAPWAVVRTPARAAPSVAVTRKLFVVPGLRVPTVDLVSGVLVSGGVRLRNFHSRTPNLLELFRNV
jgi:hypothetical protein